MRIALSIFLLIVLLALQLPETWSADESYVERGLHYLAGQQQEDGSWRSLRYPDNTGIAALAALSFMSAGYVPGSGDYGRTVSRTLDYILKAHRPGGLLVSSSSHGPMYEHALCTLLFAEVWGMVDIPNLRPELEQAVQHILRSQNATGGWRYRPGDRDADLSVTASQLLALRAAQNAGVTVPDAAIQRARAYIESCAVAGGGFAYMPGDIPTFTRTALGALALYLCGEPHAERVTTAMEYLQRHSGSDRVYPYYGYYYATQVFFQLGGDSWQQWFDDVSNWLVRQQNADGSWTGEIDQTYGTALALLALTIPYQYLPSHQRWSPKP